jgi:hypothetical protein
VRRELGLATASLATLLTVQGAGAALSVPASAPTPVVSQPEASVSHPSSKALAPAYPPPVEVASGWSKSGGVTTSAVVEKDTSVSSVLLAAYQSAVAAVPASCHLPMTLLAAIGQVESGSLAGRRLDADHRPVPAVLGPVLDGKGFAAIADTDAGVFDGDTKWDRAVGPMQFIPGTWVRFGADLDGDGERNPQDVEDAAGAAAAYLCFGGRDLATTEGLRSAVLSYNHSQSYVTLVLGWKATYDTDGFGSLPALAITSMRSVVASTPTRPVVSSAPAQPSAHPAVGHPASAPPLPEEPGTKEPNDEPLVHPVVDPIPPAAPAPPGDPAPPAPSDPPTDPAPPTEEPSAPPSETPADPPACPPVADAPSDPATGLPADDPATTVDESCVPTCPADTATPDGPTTPTTPTTPTCEPVAP